MIDFAYLSNGIYGLANAHRAGTMAGHLGAAVVAGYFVGEDNGDLPAAVFKGIEGELDRVIHGEEAIWFNAKKAGVTPANLFKPLPKGKVDEEAIPSIARALEKNIAEMRESGHNVIFASLGIRALHDHPEMATAPVIDGICKLTAGFNSAKAGRGYYGKEKGWLLGNQAKAAPDSTFPPYKSVQDMAERTIAELIATAPVRKQGFGGLWHVINHATAIFELSRLGFKALAAKALPAHHRHILLWRSLPDVESELGKVPKAEHDPRDPDYWKGMLKRDEARLTHRIKTLYGFYTLLSLIPEEQTRKNAEAAFLFLMA